jgi:ATP-binding cassette subfamily B protein
MIKQLWQHLTKRRKKQFWLLLVLMVTASIMEIVSIDAVVPFLGVLTSPEKIYQHDLAQPLIQIFEIIDPAQLLLPLAIIFIMAVLIAPKNIAEIIGRRVKEDIEPGTATKWSQF